MRQDLSAHFRHAVAAVFVTTAALACADTVAPEYKPLRGCWADENVATGSIHKYSRYLTLDGVQRVRMSGVDWSGYGAAAQMANVQAVFGRVIVGGDSLRLVQDSVVWLDMTQGAPRRSRGIVEDYGDNLWHFSLTGDSLVLQFFTYPLDAPVLTTEVFRRTSCTSSVFLTMDGWLSLR